MRDDSFVDYKMGKRESSIVYGIDEERNSAPLKDENNENIIGDIANIKNVKSGLIFSVYNNPNSVYFTEDGKKAKKIKSGTVLRSSYSNAFKFEKSDRNFDYYCANNNEVLQWDDKKKELKRVLEEESYEYCDIESEGDVFLIKSQKTNMGVRNNKLQKIITDENGNVSTKNLHSVDEIYGEGGESYTSFSEVFIVGTKVYLVISRYDYFLEYGETTTLLSIDAEDNKEELINFQDELNVTSLNLNKLFDGKKIGDKFYFQVQYSTTIEPAYLPIEDSEMEGDSTTSRSSYVLYSLSEEGLEAEINASAVFTTYEFLTSNGKIYLSKKEQKGVLTGEDSYKTVYDVSLIKTDSFENIDTFRIDEDQEVYIANISDLSFYYINDYSGEQPKINLLMIPLDESSLIKNEFLNVGIDNIFIENYYEDIIFSYREEESNEYKSGILKRDGTKTIFDIINMYLPNFS